MVQGPLVWDASSYKMFEVGWVKPNHFDTVIKGWHDLWLFPRTKSWLNYQEIYWSPNPADPRR